MTRALLCPDSRVLITCYTMWGEIVGRDHSPWACSIVSLNVSSDPWLCVHLQTCLLCLSSDIRWIALSKHGNETLKKVSCRQHVCCYSNVTLKSSFSFSVVQDKYPILFEIVFECLPFLMHASIFPVYWNLWNRGKWNLKNGSFRSSFSGWCPLY